MNCLKLLVAILLSLVLTIETSAAEYRFDGGELYYDSYDPNEFINDLPDDIRRELPDVSGGDISDILDYYGFRYFMEKIFSSLKNIFPSVLVTFSSLAGILIIICMINNLCSALGMTEIRSAANMCTGLCFSISVMSMQKQAIILVETFFSSVASVMKILVSVLEGALILSGNFTMSQVASAGITVVIAVMETLYQSILLPVVTCTFILSTIAAVTGNKGLAFLVRSVKSIVTAVIIAIVTIITFVFSIQSTAAISADNFMAKTAKFALGSYIPIVGGAISESYSLFQASASAIKSYVGITGMVVIFVVCFSPLIVIVLNHFVFNIASSLSGFLGCETEGNLLSEYSSLYSVFIALLLSASVMLIISLGIISGIKLNGV